MVLSLHCTLINRRYICLYIKIGDIRNPTETRRVISERIDMSLTSTSAERVVTHLRDTGIKDALAQPIIDKVLKMRDDLHKKSTGYTYKDAQRVLNEARESGCINPLLDMSGM
jgi:hypothetical protein